eukprot:TRINITY_DN106318_c0_g1_i1.p1 TRINITY_DN106318_c0_g1~~TRINITY_DN106318_c0_g1_i1.p1  ORF type:complete len:354 (-),score=47.11 TRINITY_DN106318_c0_g1_i1:173-1165(-)
MTVSEQVVPGGQQNVKKRKIKRKNDVGDNSAERLAGDCAAGVTSVHVRTELYTRGFVEFSSGLPWSWELTTFVEQMYDRYHVEVEERLTALQAQWFENDGDRSGSAAAERVSKDMEASGVAVYVPPPSADEQPPYLETGPRFYVSVTAAAWKHWPDGAPAPPKDLAAALWPHEADGSLVSGTWPNMIRGIGWALAPPKSDPQTLHADIWGWQGKPRPGRVRFHHFLWKRVPGECCTTQVVPGGFTDGQSWAEHYSQLICARAPCILVDNEVLHRGAPNKSDRWVSTCSIELCTRTGYDEVWKGCGEDDGVYKLLPIRWKRREGESESAQL